MRTSRFFPLALLAAALAFVSAGRAEEGDLRASGPEVRKAVIAVIDGQLAAFRAHDLNRAYGYAAIALRQQFTLERFAATVKQGYPEVWSSARAEYGIVQDNGVRALLNVRVFGKGGVSASYDYILFKEPAGWKVGGVSLHAERPAGPGSA